MDQRLSNYLDEKEAERIKQRDAFFSNLDKEVEQMKAARLAKDKEYNELTGRENKFKSTEKIEVKHKFHYWANSRSGIVLSGSKFNPCKKGKSVYLGHSSDSGWPKRMSTGRLIHVDPHGSPMARQKKDKKKL